MMLHLETFGVLCGAANPWGRAGHPSLGGLGEPARLGPQTQMSPESLQTIPLEIIVQLYCIFSNVLCWQ